MASPYWARLAWAGRRTLVLEAMGRRSNLILLDGEGRVIDSLRRVDADMSAGPLLLFPGLIEGVQQGGKAGIGHTLRRPAVLAHGHAGEKTLDAFLLDQYFGLSPLMARELAFQAAGDVDARERLAVMRSPWMRSLSRSWVAAYSFSWRASFRRRRSLAVEAARRRSAPRWRARSCFSRAS